MYIISTVCIIINPVFHIRKAKAQHLSKLHKMQTKALLLIKHSIFSTSGPIFILRFTGQN